jgi:hypothetical protein
VSYSWLHEDYACGAVVASAKEEKLTLFLTQASPQSLSIRQTDQHSGRQLAMTGLPHPTSRPTFAAMLV